MDSVSIHPRVVKGRTVYDKVNTAKPYKRVGKGKLGKAQAALTRRRTAHAATLASLPLGERMAFRTPGSMKGC